MTIQHTKKGSFLEVRKEKELRKPYHRTQDASPIFPYVNAQILTTAEQLFDLHEDTPATAKYGAFTDIRITNTSSYDILFYKSQDRNKGVFIASGTTISMNKSDLAGGYTSFILYNLGAGTIAANEIRIECFKAGATIDSTMKLANKKIHEAMRLIRGF